MKKKHTSSTVVRAVLFVNVCLNTVELTNFDDWLVFVLFLCLYLLCSKKVKRNTFKSDFVVFLRIPLSAGFKVFRTILAFAIDINRDLGLKNSVK